LQVPKIYLPKARVLCVVGTLLTFGVVDKQLYFVAECLVVVRNGHGPRVIRLRWQQMSRSQRQFTWEFFVGHYCCSIREIRFNSIFLQPNTMHWLFP